MRCHPRPHSGMQACCPHHRSMQVFGLSLSHHHAVPYTSHLPCHVATCSTRHDPVITSTLTKFFFSFRHFFLINSNLIGHQWSRNHLAMPPSAAATQKSPPCHVTSPRLASPCKACHSHQRRSTAYKSPPHHPTMPYTSLLPCYATT